MREKKREREGGGGGERVDRSPLVISRYHWLALD